MDNNKAVKYKKVQYKYGNYDIYTEQEEVIKALQDRNGYRDKCDLFVSIFLMFLPLDVIILATAFEIQPYLWKVALYVVGGICCALTILFFIFAMHFSNLNDKCENIIFNFEYSKEYKDQLKEIEFKENNIKNKILKNKARELVYVYDMLDDKHRSAEQRAELIKEYMQED
ncbi:hypothetical protein [uncultured Clostridium sp.]|uniref:hypothetical protein n=1 Tax=uncultured Clostridium sp. TaxID=59620 RepID=UPI0026324C43|nr:hypothetical protein [uncultured Clostridium sp.]